MTENYSELLKRCISKGIVLTCDVDPISIPCGDIKKNVPKDTFKEIGKQLISEVRKIERNSEV